MDIWNVDIVTGSSECTAELVFVTSLDLPDFEVLLRAAQPGTWISDPGISYRNQIYGDLPLNVNGVSGLHDAISLIER